MGRLYHHNNSFFAMVNGTCVLISALAYAPWPLTANQKPLLYGVVIFGFWVNLPCARLKFGRGYHLTVRRVLLGY